MRSCADMAIRIICPDCQTTYHLADEYAGKKVRCKKCAAMFLVEFAKAKPEVADDERIAPGRPKTRQDERGEREEIEPLRPCVAVSTARRNRREDADEDFRPRKPRARRRKSSHFALFLILGSLIVSLAIVAGC